MSNFEFNNKYTNSHITVSNLSRGINVKDIGLIGNGTTNDATLLNAYVTLIGSTKVDLVFASGTYLISTNVTFPANINLIFLHGGILKVSNGILITGTSTAIDSGLYQIFDLSLGGTIAGTWNTDYTYPEWFGVKGDGITDDTANISKCLNSTISKNVKFCQANYLITGLITINDSTTSKSVVGNAETVFKCSLSSTGKVFNMITRVDFSNITFDFLNGYCQTGLQYQQNLGLVKIKNLNFINVKDINSATSSNLIYIEPEGNLLDVSNIYCNSILKRGNGIVSDGGGSVGCVYYGGSITGNDALGGKIHDCTFNNIHNINSSDVIIFEDTFGIYLATAGKNANLSIYNIKGYEFGKRLIKNQSSKVTINNIVGEAHLGDTLSVIGTGSEAPTFYVDDVKISSVRAIGLMDYPLSTSSTNTTINDCDINSYGSNSLNNGNNCFGIYLGNLSDHCKISNCKITAKRPIGIYNTSDVIKDIKISNVDAYLPSDGIDFITQPSGATNGFDGLYLNDIKIYTAPTISSSRQSLIYTASTTLVARNKNLQIQNVQIISSDEPVSSYTRSNMFALLYTDNIKIRNITYKNSANTVYLGDSMQIANCDNVDINDISCEYNHNRLLVINPVNNLKMGRCHFNPTATSTIGHIVISNSTAVSIDGSNELYKITYGTQTTTEVARIRGATTARPTNKYIGFVYLDTTLNKLITWNGTNWIDGTGSTV